MNTQLLDKKGPKGIPSQGETLFNLSKWEARNVVLSKSGVPDSLLGKHDGPVVSQDGFNALGRKGPMTETAMDYRALSTANAGKTKPVQVQLPPKQG